MNAISINTQSYPLLATPATPATPAMTAAEAPPDGAVARLQAGLDHLSNGERAAVIGAVEQRVRSTVLSLGQPLGLDDTAAPADLYQVLRLLHQTVQDSRMTIRLRREHETQTAVRQAMDAAKSLREAADERWKGALAQNITQIVGGVLQLGVTIRADKLALSGFSKMRTDVARPLSQSPSLSRSNAMTRQQMRDLNPTPAAQPKPAGAGQGHAVNRQGDAARAPAAETGRSQANQANRPVTRAEADQAMHKLASMPKGLNDPSIYIGQALNQMVQGVGGILKGYFDTTAAAHDADKVVADALGEQARFAREKEGDALRSSGDLLRDLRGVQQALDQSYASTLRVLLGGA